MKKLWAFEVHFETDRQAGIVAYRGALFKQKGSHSVHWITRRLHAGPRSSDKIVISLLSFFLDRQTDIVIYRGALCNKKGSMDPGKK